MSATALDRLAAARSALSSVEMRTGLRREEIEVEGFDDGAHLTLPAALASLTPTGTLPRGGVVQVTGSTSLLLALAGAATGEEGWCAVVACPHLGWRAAASAGLSVERTVVIPAPGPDAPTAIGALADGVDVLVLGDCPALRDRDRHSLSGRLRARDALLLSAAPWPGARVTLRAEQEDLREFDGLRLTVHTTGRSMPGTWSSHLILGEGSPRAQPVPRPSLAPQSSTSDRHLRAV